MGRVYKALVRADRWREPNRPIGAPLGADDLEEQPVDTARILPFNGDSQTDDAFEAEALPAPPEESLVFTGRFESSAARIASYAPRSIATLVDSVSLTTQPVEPAFEEPSQVIALRDLAIDPHLAAMTKDDPSSAQQYRALAASLADLTERRRLKTLLITSAEPSEGKTTVAANVAWLLAERPGSRVLLIDANTAAPGLHRAVGIESERGWLALANGSCEPAQAIVRIDPNGMYVLTPGLPGLARAAASACSSLEKLITDLAPKFGLVLVDAPAIIGSPEAQSLAAALDGTIIVARAGRTHRERVNAARKLVPKEKRIGLVLNQSEAGAENSGRTNGNSRFGNLFRRKNRSRFRT